MQRPPAPRRARGRRRRGRGVAEPARLERDRAGARNSLPLRRPGGAAEPSRSPQRGVRIVALAARGRRRASSTPRHARCMRVRRLEEARACGERGRPRPRGPAPRSRARGAGAARSPRARTRTDQTMCASSAGGEREERRRSSSDVEDGEGSSTRAPSSRARSVATSQSRNARSRSDSSGAEARVLAAREDLGWASARTRLVAEGLGRVTTLAARPSRRLDEPRELLDLERLLAAADVEVEHDRPPPRCRRPTSDATRPKAEARRATGIDAEREPERRSPSDALDQDHHERMPKARQPLALHERRASGGSPCTPKRRSSTITCESDDQAEHDPDAREDQQQEARRASGGRPGASSRSAGSGSRGPLGRRRRS